MDEARIREARRVFQARLTDFESFENPGATYRKEKDDYKRTAAAKIQKALRPLVSGEATLDSDEEARRFFLDQARQTNFFSRWDIATLKELLSEPGVSTTLVALSLACLKSDTDAGWKTPFRDLLDWLGKQGFRASLTKMVPTYLPFFWRPDRFFFIKPSAFDLFLTRLGEEPLRAGEPLTIEQYERVLTICDHLRGALSDWRPRDNIDIHNFFWFVARDGDVKPPRIQDRRRSLRARRHGRRFRSTSCSPVPRGPGRRIA